MTITAARADLVAVLAPVLPGRVFPYPPTAPAPVAPAVYVSTFGSDWAETGYAASFAVRLVADGATPAAWALLDDLADQCRAAIAASESCYPGRIDFDPLSIDAAAELPAYTFTVDVIVATRSWCADDAAPVTVPPSPIGVPLP